jgi:hypothetical protein
MLMIGFAVSANITHFRNAPNADDEAQRSYPHEQGRETWFGIP